MPKSPERMLNSYGFKGHAEMKPSRIRGSFVLPLTIIAILAGAVAISLLFFSFWQKLNQKVEVILKDQFNQHS